MALVTPKSYTTRYTYDTADIIQVSGKLSPIAEKPFIEITLDNSTIGVFTVALFPTEGNIETVTKKLERAYGCSLKTPTGTDRKRLTKSLISQLADKPLPKNIQVFQDPDTTEIDLPWGEPRGGKTPKKQKQGTVSCEW